MRNITVLDFDVAYHNHTNNCETSYLLCDKNTGLGSIIQVMFNKERGLVENVLFGDSFKDTLPECYQDNAAVQSIQKVLSKGVENFLSYNPFTTSHFTLSVEIKNGIAKHAQAFNSFTRYPMNDGNFVDFSTDIRAAIAQAILEWNTQNANYKFMLKPIELQIRRLLDKSNDTVLYRAVLSDTFAVHEIENRCQEDFSFCTMNVITDITALPEISFLTDVLQRLPYNGNDLIYSESLAYAEKRSLYDQYMAA